MLGKGFWGWLVIGEGKGEVWKVSWACAVISSCLFMGHMCKFGGVSVKGGGNLGCDIKRLILHRFQSTILYTTGFSQLCCFVSEGDFNKIFSYCFHIKEAPEFLLVIVSLMLWGTVPWFWNLKSLETESLQVKPHRIQWEAIYSL